MKRFLHALAALWPKVKDAGRPPATPTSTGLRQHLAAVLRMERALCGFADLPIRGFAEETVGASALSTVRDQLPESPDTRLVDSPDTRLPESSTQQLTESPDTRLIESPAQQLNESPDTRLIESPDTRHADSPNQPQSLPRIPQPMPLLTILMLVFFMCLMAAKQVSAQAEPAEAAKWIIPHGGVVLGDSLPDWFWEVELSVVNHPEGNEIVRMADYKDKLLVLDFWATYCSPCVASLIKWDSLARFFSGQVAVIGIHLFDFAQRAQPFAEKMGWILPIADGNATDTLLNQLFYERRRFGQVWVKDGRLLAIPKNKVVSRELVSAVLLGARPEIEMEESHTYFDPERERKTEY